LRSPIEIRYDRIMSTSPLRAVAAVARKPMAKVTRVALFEREIRERMSGPALDLLLGSAQVLSEGSVTPGAGGSTFFGSTMLTIDLTASCGAFREACDAAAARRVAQLMGGDARVAKRARAIAEREAAARLGRPMRIEATDVRVRAQGTTVFVDVDLEAKIR
jgi:hypothetical protein